MRLRQLVPRRRGRAGLGSLIARRLLAGSLLPAVLSITALSICSGCGESGSSGTATLPSSSPPAPRGPAFGLTEDNAELLTSPTATGAPEPSGFGAARAELTALHPSYVRLLVDWAALQPSATRPPDLEVATSGCARTVEPCGGYRGVAAQLAAIATQQRAAKARGEDAFEVVLDVFGTPAWAAVTPSGCELAGTRPFSRPISRAGLAGYRELIRSLLALGVREGVALPWWSPWNEPNNAQFLSPQRVSCTASASSHAPAVYAQLATAMADELAADGGTHHLLLGELGAYTEDSPHRTSIASFLAGLPASTICLSETWSIHLYASYGGAASAAQPLAALERALDARGGCGWRARVWITEAGVGAPRAGARREASAASEREGCLALASQLANWVNDERVEVVMQYTFRDDPAYPVGLLSADLTQLYPAYRLWLLYTRARAQGQPLPPPVTVCA
jgi:hypothetical protein